MNEPGVVYRCSLPGSCEEVEPAVIEDERVVNSNINMLIYKKRSWFGAAMSIERNSGFITVYIYKIVPKNIFTYYIYYLINLFIL